MPRISVIIPTYNHDKYISEAIESVLNQTYQDFEIIITNDGSTDNTIKVIESFKDERIKLFSLTKNQGVATASNHCIKQAKGEFIAILDSDDIFFPDKLAKQVEFLDNHPHIGAVFSYAHIIDDDGNDLQDKNHFYQTIFIQNNRNRFQWLNFFFFHANCLCNPSVLIRKECYDQVGQYEPIFSPLHDFDFWVRLCMKYEIYILPEELIKVRVRNNEQNLTGNRPDAIIRHHNEYAKILQKYLYPEVVNNFELIFGQSKYEEIAVENRVIAFEIAMLSIELGTSSHQHFGLNTIYDIFLNNPENAVEKLKNYNFSYPNLYKLAGKQDLFNLISKHQLRTELQASKNQIAAMESSKFWKLRKIWFWIKNNIKIIRFTSFQKNIIRKISGKITQNIQQQNINYYSLSEDNNYNIWLNKNFPRAADLAKMAEVSSILSYKPLISIIMPVFNTPESFLIQAIESVINQVYSHWELCIADDASTQPHIKLILNEYATKSPQIKVVFREKNGHISAASNSALELAKGEFIALLYHDDLLTPDALYEVVLLLNRNPQADMIYSDEDKIDENGKLREPFFKPDWCPDSFLSKMFTCHLGVYRRSIIQQINGFRIGYEGSQDYDLVLRFTEKTDKILHIPKILYHWRIHNESTSGNPNVKNYAYKAAEKALLEAINRRGEPGKVIPVDNFLGHYVIRYDITEYKLVSIIIPTRNLGKILNKCLESIFTKTIYPNYEVILIDNGSTETETLNIIDKWLKKEPNRFKCYPLDIPFNYPAINNYAVTKAKGDYLLFLNNDTEVITSDWINAMVEQVQRPSIGAVGALLLYPDNTIQHAGVVLGIGGLADHSHRHFSANNPGYFCYIQTVNNYSAVTGACLMCRREVFEKIGGFEKELAVAFNDVDLCLKIIEKGYKNIYLPHVKLYHYESKSRGDDHTLEKQKRALKEIHYMQSKWKNIIDNDPCYNPNLTRDYEDFSIKI